MSLKNVLNGETWQIEPGVDFRPPWNQVLELVPLAIQPSPEEVVSFEAPLINFTNAPASDKIQEWWKIEEGWVALSQMLKSLADCVKGVSGGKVISNQQNVYEDKSFEPVESRFIFRFEGGEHCITEI